MAYVKQLLRLSALVLLGAAAALPVNFTALKYEGYVNDFAGVVDAASRERLTQFCTSLEQATGVQLAIVTVPTLAGEPVEDVAHDLLKAWGVGHKGKDDGLLLLLSIEDRRSRLEVGYGLEGEIPDGFAGQVLDAMRPYLRQQRYGDALLEAAGEVGGRIARARNISLPTPQPQPQRRLARESPLPVGVIMGGLLLFFLLSGLMGRGRGGRRGGGLGGILPWLILGNLMGGGWGSGRGGGGFGGFDSGGGFGGFGGGDSGGGGASSGW